MEVKDKRNLHGLIEAQLVVHKGENRIKLIFQYSEQLLSFVRTLDGILWSRTMRCWHVPDNEQNRKVFGLSSDEKATYTKKDKAPDEKYLPQIERFGEWLKSQRYSEKTITRYTESMLVFCRFYSGRDLATIDNTDIVNFNYNYILKNNFSDSYQNQVITALKLFFRLFEKKKIVEEELERPRKSRRLPEILSTGEVEKILRSCMYLKHKTMLSLIYACGLRRSELLNLRPVHVDSQRNLLIIKEAKGKKDRYTPLPDKMIAMLREYYKVYRPVHWLFEGSRPGEQYTESSLQQVFHRAVKKAGIKKKVSLHTLRHSYATHLLEKGTDLRYIQEILGHKSSRTTEIYTHVTRKSIEKIKSPLEDLDIG